MMSHSRRTVGAVILGAIALSGWVGYASAQSLPKLVLVDGSGFLVGELSTKAPVVDPATGKGKVEVKTRATSAPKPVTMSPLAPAPTATAVLVTVEVPSSLPVGFCVSGDYYNRSTGLCADGNQDTARQHHHA